MDEKLIGKRLGEYVTFDGSTVRTYPTTPEGRPAEEASFDATRDFDLNGTFRNWLGHRGVVLP